MEEYQSNYREVIPDQTISQNWKDIALNTGASQSTLQDIKVAEKAGGYSYKDVSKAHNRNRFIYWRTNHDILELSEVSLDISLSDNNVRYKFTDSPVLSVAILENHNFVVILVATVNSIHRLSFSHPDKLHKTYAKGTMQGYSIFHEATANTIRDPSTFYVIGHTTSSNYPIPHAANCWLQQSGQEAIFSLAYQTSLMLFTMNCVNGQTVSQELKEHYIVPRIFSNITGALRGKSNSTDSQYVTSMVFNDIGGMVFLYALYRDNYIRMWSTKTGQCMATVNCLQQDGAENRTQGPQSNILRRGTSSMICAFLCHSIESEFVTIHIQWDGAANYSMTRNHYIPAPQYDLVDFELSDSRIWSLWCNSQGEFNVSSYSLCPPSAWIPAILESQPDRYSVQVEHGMEPRQTYSSFIFHPGKFQRSVIAKALMMFRRANILSDSNVPMSFLRDRVSQAIEAEIQNEIKDFEITDEEYIDISLKFWERFYSCCEQYNVKACQPIGLVIMESLGAVCMVKKSAFSLLRPCETLEHLMLAGDSIDYEQLITNATLDRTNAYKGMAQLIHTLAILDQHILEDINTDFDNKLYQLKIPNAVAAQIAHDLLTTESEESTLQRTFLIKLRQQIKSIPDLVNSMLMLLDALRMGHGEPEAININDALTAKDHGNVQSSRILQSIGYLFASDAGISLVAESVRQMAQMRYSLCRSLLILQHILIDSFDLPSQVIEMIRSRCMPETVVFVQAYYVMVWISVTPAQTIVPSASLETSVQRLSIMPSVVGEMPTNGKRSQQPITLLELFLREKGLMAALSLLAEDQYRNLTDSQWQFSLLPLATIVGQLVWAVSGNFTFGEWLMGSGQHVLIQEYVRLLNSWCEWNKCSRYFVVAVSLLGIGETHKAFDLFMESVKGVLTEPFLERIVVQSNECTSHEDAMCQYYLKVIQLFEQYSALDYVIELAKTAIGILDKNDPQLPMFQSIIFTNHLKLEHYTEAYQALTDIAESSQRKDCLRKLVVCLFEEKRLDLLMQFPYIRLADDLVDIVESRARSMAIEGNNYYNFLYSLHVTRDNMRKAATIMYEQAMRFALECETISALQSRYESLLTCLNALHLVDSNYAWIAKPVINEDANSGSSGGVDAMDTDRSGITQQITVLEIKDIKEEALLTEAMLLLAKNRQDMISILNTDPDQLIAVLANAKLYTAAVKLGRGLRKSVSSVLESLASTCVRENDENSNEPWSWLQENDLADLPHRNNAIEMAWKLLERLIAENELTDSTVLRKNVTNKILNLGAFLPHWLYLSYRQSNPSELLRLYVNHGRLIEATRLANDYISAMIGGGGEYFDLKNSLNVTQPALCFPINTIDLLLYGLEINAKMGNEYERCLHELKANVDRYVETARRISNDKIQCAAIRSY